MKRSVLLLLLCGISCTSVHAQKDLGGVSNHASMRDITPDMERKLSENSRQGMASQLGGAVRKHSMRRVEAKPVFVVQTDSQVYYAHVERRNGWIVGVGKPVPVREAKTLAQCFRLSRPNGHGHWQHVESLGEGKPRVSPQLAPYWDCPSTGLTSKAEQWMRQSRTATEWHQTAGPDGEELLEERACDARHQLLFTTLYTPLDDNSANLAFTDSNGLPVDVNPQGVELAFEQVGKTLQVESISNTYGTTVLVLRDAAGRDSLVSLRDGNGYLKSRADGVTVLKFIRDVQGRTVYELSINVCDRPVLRRSGYCGWRYTYDGDSPEPVSRMKVGTDLRPMNMPEGNSGEAAMLTPYKNEHPYK